MKTARFSETSAPTNESTRRRSPEYRCHYPHRCEKLKFHTVVICSQSIINIDSAPFCYLDVRRLPLSGGVSLTRPTNHWSTSADRTRGFLYASYVVERYNNELECSPCYERERVVKATYRLRDFYFDITQFFVFLFGSGKEPRQQSFVSSLSTLGSCDRTGHAVKDPS